MNLSQINSLQLEPTSFCNLACPHCPRTSIDGYTNVELSHWDAKTVMKNFQTELMINLQKVVIEGDFGDPLMHPNIKEILNQFISHPNAPQVIVTTNGTIRDSGWWASLPQAKNFVVTFSIDGLEDTNHIYRVGANFDTIMKNARAFIDNGGQAVWKCIVFRHNQHQLEQIAQFAKEMGFVKVNFVGARTFNFQGQKIWKIKYRGKETGTTLEQSTIAQQDFAKYNTVFDNRVFDTNWLPPITNRERICTNLSYGHLYVNSKGNVMPCCMMNYEIRNLDLNPQLGACVVDKTHLNLHNYTMSEILENEFFNKNLLESLNSNQPLALCNNMCGANIQKNKEMYGNSRRETTIN